MNKTAQAMVTKIAVAITSITLVFIAQNLIFADAEEDSAEQSAGSTMTGWRAHIPNNNYVNTPIPESNNYNTPAIPTSYGRNYSTPAIPSSYSRNYDTPLRGGYNSNYDTPQPKPNNPNYNTPQPPPNHNYDIPQN